jgi:hypothetical protein
MAIVRRSNTYFFTSSLGSLCESSPLFSKTHIMKAMQKLLVVAAMILSGLSVSAQSRKDAFWVVEGNPSRQQYTIVRFYSGDRRLIGEERVERKWIDLTRKRNLRSLNRKLQQKLDADSASRMAVVRKKD